MCDTFRDHAHWIGSLIHALEFYGSVPELPVHDNPKALIATANRYKPVLGNTMQDFVNHYAPPFAGAAAQAAGRSEGRGRRTDRRAPDPCAAVRPPVLQPGRAIGKLIADLNRRPFKKLKGNHREWFERLDKPALRPSPTRRYEKATFVKCRVNIDYRVEVDHHYYGVPHSQEV